VSAPFTDEVTSAPWLTSVTSWIAEALAEQGVDVVGPPRQVRVRPWSTQLVVPTSAGHVWFKAGTPALAYEGALQATIARLVPGAVTTPLAVHPGAGWMLSADHGASVRDLGPTSAQDWVAIAVAAALLQRALVAHADALAAAGLPDGSPSSAPARFDSLLTDLPEDARERLRALRPRLVGACDELLDSPFPVTWQHGDLHPGNVVAQRGRTDSGATLFDLGDADRSHALEVLAVPRSMIEDEATWGAVLAAYGDVWGVGEADTRRAWASVPWLHAVNRTQAWRRALARATPAEVEHWFPDPTFHLNQLQEHA
jgi:Phosphotransferase enzyme family